MGDWAPVNFCPCYGSWIYNYMYLYVQTVPITTKVVSSNPVHGDVYLIQHYVISLSVTCDRLVVFSGHSGFVHQ